MLRNKIRETFRRFQSIKKREKISRKKVVLLGLSGEARGNIVRSIRQHL